MSERSDFTFNGGVFTHKVMPNGETRTRVKFGDGLVSTVARMPEWTWNDGLPWQEAHSHKGLTEVYRLISGWAIVGKLHPQFADRNAPWYLGVAMTMFENQVLAFDPNEVHIVLLGPRATMHTTLTGVPKGNPERNENDWWPYLELDEYVRRWDAEGLKSAIIRAGGVP